MEYQNFSVEDFVSDQFFQEWVLTPTHESELFWIKWLLQYPEKRDEVELARSIVLSLEFGDNLDASEIEEEWDKLYLKITDASAFNPAQTNESDTKSTWWQNYNYIAAAFAGLIVVIGVYFVISFTKKVETITYATSYGETREIELPDGSIVTLNAASEITFSKEWDESADREIWLDGEAFFSVIHTKDHQKFTVHTDEQSSIEVLGTKFNVYDRRRKVQVFLEEGKVQVTVKEENNRIILTPGDLVEWSEEDDKISIQKADSQLYTSWKKNEIIFENVSLREVAQTLEDINGVKVSFKDTTLRELKFTGSLSTNDLDNFLLSLSKSFRILVKHEGNQVTFNKMK